MKNESSFRKKRGKPGPLSSQRWRKKQRSFHLSNRMRALRALRRCQLERSSLSHVKSFKFSGHRELLKRVRSIDHTRITSVATQVATSSIDYRDRSLISTMRFSKRQCRPLIEAWPSPDWRPRIPLRALMANCSLFSRLKSPEPTEFGAPIVSLSSKSKRRHLYFLIDLTLHEGSKKLLLLKGTSTRTSGSTIRKPLTTWPPRLPKTSS